MDIRKDFKSFQGPIRSEQTEKEHNENSKFLTRYIIQIFYDTCKYLLLTRYIIQIFYEQEHNENSSNTIKQP